MRGAAHPVSGCAEAAQVVAEPLVPLQDGLWLLEVLASGGELPLKQLVGEVDGWVDELLGIEGVVVHPCAAELMRPQARGAARAQVGRPSKVRKV